MTCRVKGCGNYIKKTRKIVGSEIKYFTFPKNPEIAEQWRNACGKDNVNVQTGRICCKHFDDTCFVKPLQQQMLNYSPSRGRKLRLDAIPTLYLPLQTFNISAAEDAFDRTMHPLSYDNASSIAEACHTAVPLPVSVAGTFQEVSLQVSNDALLTTQDLHEVVPSVVSGNALSPTDNEALPTFPKIDDILSENAAMKAKLHELEQKIKTENQRFESRMYNLLGKFLTPGQIRLLLNPSLNKIKWSSEDITNAISLRCASPKGYRYMKNVMKIPLPGLSTLRRWANKISIEPGILSVVLNVMRARKERMSNVEKLIVLTFDEMYLSNKISIDRETEQVIGPHKTCQCVMVRSLFSSWKQPIYYKYDEPMAVSTLFNIISKLHDSGYIVVAITSDMGPGNVKVWSELGIGMYPKKCYFQHPVCDDLQIFVFADMPHLLKLLRNHFVDNGFYWKGKKIESLVLQKLISLNSKDLKIAYKLTSDHLTVQGLDRQKVLPAAQVLSNTTAHAIKWCSEKGFLQNIEFEDTATFIQLCNDWFDIFNAKSKFHKVEGKCAYGVHIQKQNEILDQMTAFISECRIGQHKSMLNFQKGICVSNVSLQQLLPYLQEKYDTYNISYILTYRLNQDLLEHFFSFVRSLGATYDHPNALDFRFRLKRYILGKHSSELLSSKSNVTKSNEIDISSSELDESLLINIQAPLDSRAEIIEEPMHCCQESCVCENNNCISFHLSSFTPTYEEEQLLLSLDKLDIGDIMEEETLKYVAGYVAFRFKHKYNTLGVETRHMDVPNDISWLQFISRGKCIYPSEQWLQSARIINTEFEKLHGMTLRKEKYIFQTLHNLISPKLAADIPNEVILCLIRTRTYIRVNELNKALITAVKLRKHKKKMIKFTNK